MSDFKIESINSWRHRDAAFIVQLGHACGWTIHPNPNGAIRMFSQDGTQVTVPDNTSLNINVFRSWTSKVWRHRRTTVSPKAFEALVGESRLDRPHIKIAWGATGLEPPTPLPEVSEDAMAAATVAAMIDSALHEEAEASVALDGETQSIEYEKPRIDRPAADFKDHGEVAVIEPNAHKKNKSSQKVIISDHVLRRTWSDGYIDFVCADCGHVSSSPSGIGGHRVVHGPHATARGAKGAAARAAMKEEVLAERAERKREKDAERKRKDRERKRREYVPAAERETTGGTMPPPPPAWSDTVKLQQIADLVFPSMLMRIEAITDERDAAIARAEKAEGDLDALRDLLGARK